MRGAALYQRPYLAGGLPGVKELVKSPKMMPNHD
jgi:hypothetical protein